MHDRARHAEPDLQPHRRLREADAAGGAEVAEPDPEAEMPAAGMLANLSFLATRRWLARGRGRHALVTFDDDQGARAGARVKIIRP